MTSLSATAIVAATSTTTSALAELSETVLFKSTATTYQQKPQRETCSLPDDVNVNSSQFILIRNCDNVVNIQINSRQREVPVCGHNTTTASLVCGNNSAVSKVKIQTSDRSGNFNHFPITASASKALSMFHEIPDSSGCIRINLTTRNQQPDPYLSNTVYYSESLSGQCSPSDTLDSGTCSDLDGTPPPLPKKRLPKTKKPQPQPQSEASVDSDEGESHVSYDSLNSATSTDDDPSLKNDGFLPKKLLADIRDKQKFLKEIPSIKTTIYRARKEQYDRFYEFHLNENLIEEKESSETDGVKEVDDSFAGLKTLPGSEKVLVPETIRSSKGTVRGVKNRVRAGIATFLHIQSTEPNFKEKDLGKIVVYTTTMGIVRDTYQQCVKVKQILRTLMVKYEERDVFMSYEYQNEIKSRLKSNQILVPQLFVDGVQIGNADNVERLNESGELRKILKPFKSLDACNTCQMCGGFRLLPCPICNGSKKSVHRNHFTTEFVALKCMNCDEVGLVRCNNC